MHDCVYRVCYFQLGLVLILQILSTLLSTVIFSRRLIVLRGVIYVQVCVCHRNRLNLLKSNKGWMDGSYREGGVGMKKACDAPYLSFTLSSTELSPCHVTGWLSQWLCSSSIYWSSLACRDSHDLVCNSFVQVFSCFSLTHKAKRCFSDSQKH